MWYNRNRKYRNGLGEDMKKNIIIGISAVLFIALLIILLFVVKSNKKETKMKYSDLIGKHYVLITVKDYGEIKVELDADEAPITVTNFMNLVDSGFYDGLTFHRIMEGFMVQGGDPNGNGTGGSKNKIKGEFSANGVENNISHTRGTISMARSKDMNSASSQFFIVQKDSVFLDGQYAGFGHVISGMGVVDQIASDAEPIDDNGTIEKINQPIIESIKIVEE